MIVINTPFMFGAPPFPNYEFDAPLGSEWIKRATYQDFVDTVADGMLGLANNGGYSLIYAPGTLLNTNNTFTCRVRPDANYGGFYLRGANGVGIVFSAGSPGYIQTVDENGGWLSNLATQYNTPVGTWVYCRFQKGSSSISVQTSTTGNAGSFSSVSGTVPLSTLGGSVAGVGFHSQGSGQVLTADWLRKT